MNKLKKRRKAFTLIEMVVVIAIVVIIAAIAIPQALKAINKSKASTDFANARSYAGEIMNKVANGDIVFGTKADKGEKPLINEIDKNGTNIGIKAQDIKLRSEVGNKYFYKYNVGQTGNDEIEIYIGKTAPDGDYSDAKGADPVRIYPKVDSLADYGQYVK